MSSAPLSLAVTVAMFECPVKDGRAVLSRDECERMVWAAITAHFAQSQRLHLAAIDRFAQSQRFRADSTVVGSE